MKKRTRGEEMKGGGDETRGEKRRGKERGEAS